MKLLLSAVVAMSCLVPSASHALNDREQGILIGAVISGLIRGHVDHERNRDRGRDRVYDRQPQPVIVYPYPPVINAPPVPRQRLCLNHPYYDHYGRIIGYTYSCH